MENKDKRSETAVQAQSPEQQVLRAEKAVKAYQSFLLRLALTVLVVWALFFLVIGVLRMPSEDMHPRIDAGDLILFYRLDKDVKAQDIVVLDKYIPEFGENETFVCRVVAVEGDTVEISDGERLIVNGSTMIEPNIYESTPRYEGFVEYPVTLGEGECFVLADARDGGSDSRFFGPVQKDELVGTVITILRRNKL